MHRVGESGLWLLESDGRVSHMISKERKADIQEMLRTLEERKWSEPVNGHRLGWSVRITTRNRSSSLR